MAWKTLLSVVTRQEDPAVNDAALNSAVALARRFDAHLDVLALGLDKTQVGYFYAGASAMIYQETLERAQTEAEETEALVRRRMTPEEVRWSVDRAVAQLGGMSALISQRARFSDMVVLPRPYGSGRGPAEEAVIEAALFEGRVPVLVLPDGMAEPPAFDRAVVAWNQSPEAISAIRKALPLLQRASIVDITIIDPPSHGPERSDPGGMLSQWLARHGVRCEVSVLARTMPRVSDVLMRHVGDRDANLLVMGAYGHSRFREAILGGATRDLLETASVPVLMAH